MGVRFQRTVASKRDKRGEAAEFAAAISEYIEKTWGIPVTWGLEVGGMVGRVHWYVDYENMSQLESILAKTMVDEDYNKLVDSANDLFEGPTEDTLVYTM